MKQRKIMLSCIWFLAVAVTANAQFQRMGISRGTISIAPAGSSEVATYCLDYTRHAPPPTTEYGSVLTSGGSARVSFGGQTMSLQEAIASKKVRVHGATGTFAELLSSIGNERGGLTAAERQELRILQSEWAGLSREEKAEVEEEFRPLLAQTADYQHLQIENLTKYPMTASFDGAILGVEDEALPATAPSTIAPAGSRMTQRINQNQQWRTTTMHQQALLKQVHAYDGPVDGDYASEAFKAAIVKFQREHMLKPTGILDGDSETLLRATAAQPWQQSVNAQASFSKLATVTIKRSPDAKARYSVYSSGESPAYEGNDIRGIAAALRSSNATGGTLYLNLEGFSDANREDFASSIRNQRDLLGEDPLVVLVPRRENGDVDRDFFQPGIRIEGVSEVDQVASGPNKGLFRASVSFAYRALRSGAASIKRSTVTLLSSSRDALVTAVAMLRGQPATLAFDDQKSIADVVAMTRAHIRQAHPDLKTRDLNVQFRNEVGLSQWVLLRQAFRQALPV